MARGESAAAEEHFAGAAVEALIHLALTRQGEGRLATLEKAEALAPEGAAALRAVIAAERAMADDDPAAAEAALEQAVASDPQGLLYERLAEAERGQGKLAAAAASYRAALDLDPGSLAARLGLGDVLREGGDFAAAAEAYGQAIEADPSLSTAYLGRAAARLFAGDLAGSRSDLDRAAELAPPGFPRHRALLAYPMTHAYARTLPEGSDRFEQAIAMWRELGRPDMAAAVGNAAGRVFLETGSPAAGRAWYDRAWRIVEDSSLAEERKVIWRVRHLHALARVAAQQGDLDSADRLSGEAAALEHTDPANAEHYAWIQPYLTGYLHLARRRYDAALHDLQASDLERPFIRYLIGRASESLGRLDEARAWFEKAVAGSVSFDTEAVIVRPLAEEWLRSHPAPTR